MKKGEIDLIKSELGKVLSFPPIDKILQEIKVLMLCIILLTFFPIQLISWMINKKEFRHTNPYYKIIKIIQ